MELPYITKEIKGIGGTIKEQPSHFIVEEIPLYEPSGEGNHLYINFTKKGITTKDVLTKVASLLKIKNKDIGCAGMKDKHAITTQTISVNLDKLKEKVVLEKIEELPIKINWTKKHKNKIRTGHLLGNKFEIVISNIDLNSFGRAEKIFNLIQEKGVPNYYGPQRFGIEGKNHEKGLKIIKGKINIRDRWLKRFLISSYQSYLCNQYLALRVEKGLFDKILKGDIAKKYETGGLFVVEDIEKDQKRYENKEISFTAPIFGKGMGETFEDSRELENDVLEKEGISMEKLEKAKVEGTRRLGRLLIEDLSMEKAGKNLILSFSLPKGAFATTILREFIKK